MGRRAGIVLLALLGALVGVGLGAGTAAADDGTTTTVTPSTNLAAPEQTSICSQLQAQKAAVNAQITAIANALPLAPAQKAQLEAVRAQVNARLNAALAGAGCPAT